MSLDRLFLFLGLAILQIPSLACNNPAGQVIDRQGLVQRHFPKLAKADPSSPHAQRFPGISGMG
jgi:hypothetical protein